MWVAGGLGGGHGTGQKLVANGFWIGDGGELESRRGRERGRERETRQGERDRDESGRVGEVTGVRHREVGVR